VAKLIYVANTSLDGYVADETGTFDWTAPSPEVLGFINDLVRPVATYLYGRKLYETMLFWENAKFPGPEDQLMRDFAELWQAADKVVYSTSLETVSSARTRIERSFEPDAIRKLKQASAEDMTVGGSQLAAQAIKAGLVDEYHLLVVPVLVGGGKPALPAHVRAQLELLDERRFGSGTVHLHYRTRV